MTRSRGIREPHEPISDKETIIMSTAWKDGLTASAIVIRLRMAGFRRSRSSVCGKLHRLGLMDPAQPKRGQARKVPKPVKEPVLVKSDIGEPKPALADKQGAPIATPEAIDDSMCHWPYGEVGTADFHYCGHPGNPYCPEHARKSRQNKTEKKDALTRRVGSQRGFSNY